MSKPITRRIVICGLGHMGSYHLRVASQLEGVEIVGAVDPDPERRSWAAAAYPRIGGTYSSLAGALEYVERPDCVVIASPAVHLAELSHEALTQHLPLLVEKPLAAEESDAQAIVEHAERLGLLLGVGYVERCNPAVAALKKYLDAGTMGRIYQVQARRLSPYPDRHSVLGVSLDLATHDIDIMRYLIGSEIEYVFAEAVRGLHDSTEDLIAATLRFADSTTGLLEVGWLAPTKVRELVITGEGGMFVVNYLSQELCFYGRPTKSTSWDALRNLRGAGEGDMTRYALQRQEPLRIEWEAFLQATDGVETLLALGRDGCAALSTACAIQRSGISHEPVEPGYRAAALK